MLAITAGWCCFIQKLNFSSKAEKLSASKTFRLISIWFSFVLETCGKASRGSLNVSLGVTAGQAGSRVMRHNLLFCLVLIMAGWLVVLKARSPRLSQ